MTNRPPRDVAASVRARLLSRSRESGEDFQFPLQRYTAEQILSQEAIAQEATS